MSLVRGKSNTSEVSSAKTVFSWSLFSGTLSNSSGHTIFTGVPRAMYRFKMSTSIAGNTLGSRVIVSSGFDRRQMTFVNTFAGTVGNKTFEFIAEISGNVEMYASSADVFLYTMADMYKVGEA